MGAITCALRHVLRDDDLRFGVDGDLSIVGLHEPVLALHDPALWIGKVLLGFGVRRRGRRSGFPAAFAPALGFPLRLHGAQFGPCSRRACKAIDYPSPTHRLGAIINTLNLS